MTEVDNMSVKESFNNIKITLPLIALCLPLFVEYHATAENSCPYETFIRVDSKCVDISERGLNDITEELNVSSAVEVNKQIKEVSKELEELSEELEEFCVSEYPETSAQIEIMEDMCQY